MYILFDNVEWMTLNIILAFLGVILGIIFFYARNKFIKTILFIIWILYLPNTIYLITDTQHFSDQWLKLAPSLNLVLVVQYIVLILIGIITFLICLYILEKFFYQTKLKKDKTLITILIFFFNYLIAFGVALGRINRINSIEAITHPIKVLSNSLSLITSPEAMRAIIIFGTASSLLYLYLRKKIHIKM